MTVQDNDVLRAVMEVALEDGSIAQNVYTFFADLAASQSDLTVLNAIETYMEDAYSNMSSYLPNTMTQRVCWVDEIEWNATTGLWEVTRKVGYFTPTIGFNDANEPLPNQSAPIAVFPTFRPKTRGRKFVFPFAEDAQDATFLVAAALGALADYAADVLADIVIGPLNELLPGVASTVTETFQNFDTAIVTNVLGTQRRRKPTVGI
jgi:hypothetical protein